MNLAAIRVSRKLNDLLRCIACGLPTTVLNARLLCGKRGAEMAVVSPVTHCACPPSASNPYGGPAYIPAAVPGKTDADFLLKQGAL